jgi:hypothetical protein
MIPESVATARSPLSVTRIGAGAAKPTDAHERIGPETGAHALPESEVAAFAFAAN